MRQFKDSSLKQSVALPNAGNTVNTNSINLGSARGYPLNEKVAARISTTSGVGANDKNITIKLQASNEAAANFVDVPEIASVVINEGSSAYAATNRDIQLPPTLDKKYIRATATGEANGGDASNGALTIELLF